MENNKKSKEEFIDRMLKRLKMFFCCAGLLFIISACSEEGNNELNTSNNEASTEIESPPIQNNELNMEEVKTKIDYIVSKINDIYVNAGTKYNLNEVPLSDSIYQSMSEELKPYASRSIIDSRLFEVAKEFCYGGCDAKYFPAPTDQGVRFQLNEVNGKITLEYLVPENQVSGALVETVTLTNENEEWKLDGYDFTKENFNLSKDEANEIAKQFGLGTNTNYLKEVHEQLDNGKYRKAYLFQIDGEESYQAAVYADTGFTYLYEEIQSLEEQPKQETELKNNDQNNFTSESVKSNGKTESVLNTVSKKEEYIQLLDNIEIGLSDLDPLMETGVTLDLHNAASITYGRWDDALNEIYGVLKQQLTNEEMSNLKKEQRQWITDRDRTAEQAGKDCCEGGSFEPVTVVDVAAQLTKERCYELVEKYMK